MHRDPGRTGRLLGHGPRRGASANRAAGLVERLGAPLEPAAAGEARGGPGGEAAARLAERPAWLHLDLDVLDEEVLPAVTYPQPLGLDWDELAGLARPLATAPNLVGVSVADFNPDRDTTGAHAERVVSALESLLRG